MPPLQKKMRHRFFTALKSMAGYSRWDISSEFFRACRCALFFEVDIRSVALQSWTEAYVS
jgi:hypothetical protein